MSKKPNTVKFDTKSIQFKEMLKKLDEVGGDVEKLTTKAMEYAFERFKNDTLDSLSKPNLPAQGKYSTGKTKESVIQTCKIHKNGLYYYVPIGFDFEKDGSGGFLISGTPKYPPVQKLKQMYKRKKYSSQIYKEMSNMVLDEVVKIMEGK